VTVQKRVVITGMATINPLGDNLDDSYNNLNYGKSGIKRWVSLDVSNVECKVGSDLGNYEALLHESIAVLTLFWWAITL
jgi:3-oxoacyl-(acyl-carrier-protein) synthase